jgi:exosortase A-associated hydrolase 1
VLLARALASTGIPTLRFDYRGMGDSDGKARDFQSIDDDIAAAIVALRRETGVRRCVLWGLCDGASAALMHARADPQIAGIVALNPWAHSAHTEAATQLKHYYLRRLFSAGLWRKLRAGRVSFRRSALEVAIAMRNALARSAHEAQPDYLERMEQGWSRFAGPVLIILSGNDLVAREFEEWVRASAQRRALLSRSVSRAFHVPDADHTFAHREWRDAVAKETIACLQAIVGEERG